MDRTPRNLPFTPRLPSRSDQHRSSVQNMDITSVMPGQTHLPYHPMPCTNPPSIPADRCLPPIQNLQAPSSHPTYTHGTSSRDFPRNNINFAVGPRGEHYLQSQHPQRFAQPRPHEDLMRTRPGLPRSSSETGEYRITHSQEPQYKRCRLGPEARPVSLEVGAWEIDALAFAETQHAARRAALNQQDALAYRPACSWTTPGYPATESPPPDPMVELSRKNSTWQQPPSSYPSPPHSLDDNSRRLGYRGSSLRRTSSVFSGSTVTGSPEASRSTIAPSVPGSPPTSPTITSTTSGFESRAGSTGPCDSTPTFEEIYNVPQPNRRPRGTERKSILERFPMEIFMRIMLHFDWKEQIRLRRCNSNIYDMVQLDAISWETKTAILLHEENFNPKNFPKKASRPQGNDGPGAQDSDSSSSSDEEGPSSSSVQKGKRKQGANAARANRQRKDKSNQEDIDRFACYSCFKILPAYYFEGKHLETNTSRTTKGQKKNGNNTQADKKVDTRVEYVQVISVNPSQAPEWLVKDKTQVRAAGDVESYVAERMRKGVNCDDLRQKYKDLSLGTHCIAPIRGVNPFFTPSASAVPPGCGTYRPVYQVDAPVGPGAAAGGADGTAYTYEICIPEDSLRDPGGLARPRAAPSTRICQPQTQQQPGAPDGSGSGLGPPAPEVRDIIALRRFCIPCGAKYGAYRRECNRKIISKTEERWWVCACPKVRRAGVGRNCPDCGKSVIY